MTCQASKAYLSFKHMRDNLAVRVRPRVRNVYRVVLVRKLQLKVHLIKAALPAPLRYDRRGGGLALALRCNWITTRTSIEIVLLNICILFIINVDDGAWFIPARALKLGS